jgi:spore coat protein U-like protein
VSPLRLAPAVLAVTLIAVSATPASAVTCSVSSPGVAFGNYSTLVSSALDGAGDIGVSCDVSTPFTVRLSAGSGTIDQRVMTAGTSQLKYNLYTDSARTTIWGDGVTGSTVSATGTAVTLTAYGRIPALQNVVAGSYSDSLVITVTY